MPVNKSSHSSQVKTEWRYPRQDVVQASREHGRGKGNPTLSMISRGLFLSRSFPKALKSMSGTLGAAVATSACTQILSKEDALAGGNQATHSVHKV